LDFKAKLSRNSSNPFSKLESPEDVWIPDLPLERFMDMGIKQFNHVVEKELVLCEFIDFNFLR